MICILLVFFVGCSIYNLVYMCFFILSTCLCLRFVSLFGCHLVWLIDIKMDILSLWNKYALYILQ